MSIFLAAPGLVTELVVKPINCAVKGEKYNMDAAALVNPVRAVRNIVQIAQSNHADKSSHVWIGRRCLGDGNFVGYSLFPGVDIYHWAVGINGYIYEIDVHGKDQWCIKRDEKVESGYGKSFEWFRINGGEVKRSRTALCAKADSMAGQGYGHGLGLNPNKKNCQEFCCIMIAHAMNVSDAEAVGMVAGNVGTYLL